MNDAEIMRGDSNHRTGTTNGNNMGSFDSGMPIQGEHHSEVMSGSEDGPSPMMVTPDMLYKLSKKIAQLTKVIYSLNTKNDDLEMDLDQLRTSYEDKLKLCQQQLQLATANLQQQLQQECLSETDLANGIASPENGTRRRRSKTPEIDSDAKRELKKTRQCLKQTEAKVKAMEEEIQEKKMEMDRLHKDAAARQATTLEREKVQLEAAARQALSSNGDGDKTSHLEQRIALLEQQVHFSKSMLSNRL